MNVLGSLEVLGDLYDNLEALSKLSEQEYEIIDCFVGNWITYDQAKDALIKLEEGEDFKLKDYL
jgi:hypothetical protein